MATRYPVPTRFRSSRNLTVALLCAASVVGAAAAARAHCPTNEPYTQWFRQSECTFATTGDNPYFPLQPGYWLHLRGYEDGEWTRVDITVLDETEVVAGVTTRVVEEREWVDGELVEVSRNFLALCTQTHNLFYFGEDVDIYEDGQIVSHHGAWRAGQNQARAGVLMPGSFLVGSRYYQEVAPGVALDRGCNSRAGLAVYTPAGSFQGCVEVIETSPLEPGHESVKVYCPGIGLVRDDVIRLIDWSGNPLATD